VQAKQARADVVLMDLSMPRLDGLAATRKLLTLEQAPRVIALTSHTDSLSKTAALEAGAAKFVSKEADYDTLAATILDVCGRG
jgi:DNA-binding NarL/FixJ family response regulator